ncbi:UDP-3-O-(3-hydroxymyristoyl)glucosamine N-acyltransferase [Larkinella arboricola]|uniref:UDP-3-O-acylglucosamine N-acyltransferase n=1 Tax=Larkinella arboricola TaxID=643671 RepID=A0A327WT53_LARAB|nr:UDP-3-O-(3-hydroxymyristoyl)glucosamine N-acyltransferase [Larkinella arboricola]RAJ94191.1 UDP-3-O-[3-hydroxymyristoyl] glucosamine N-acyltransferase [Larkinella arboricola]
MEFTVKQIAALLGGTVDGNDSLKINQLSKIEEGKEGSISFLSNLKYEHYLYTTAASAVIVSKHFQPRQPVKATLIFVDNSYSAFSTLLEQVNRLRNIEKTGIEQPSFIADSAQVGDGIYRGAFSYIGENCRIGNNVKIYPQVYIGKNVTVGDNTVIHSGAKILDNTVIGQNCVVKPNAVIGSEGFGFAPQPDGTYRPIPQLGNVILEDNVSIGANTTIDCATMGSTIIRQGAKIDNLIQVAHNVEIGRNTVVAAQAGIAGSSKIGENCQIGGQVGVSGHLMIANQTKIAAQAGIMKSIKQEGLSMFGAPAVELKDALRSQVVYQRLPELEKRIHALENKLNNQ